MNKTTNIEAMLIALAGISEGLVVLLTLGRVRPSWAFGAVVWIMRRKLPDEDDSGV